MMTSDDQSGADFAPITSERERARLIEALSSKAVTIVAEAGGGLKCSFRLKEIRGEKLVMTELEPLARRLKPAEKIELVFGLADGLYLLKTIVEQSDSSATVVPVGNQMFRQQRRNNFRANLALKTKIIYKTEKALSLNLDKPMELELLDLSAGGMRVKWPLQWVLKAHVGETLTGKLSLPGGKVLELKGIVRNVFPEGAGFQPVGLEFLDVSGDAEQSLLFACMQLYRQRSYAD